jgi:hypothetical protein
VTNQQRETQVKLFWLSNDFFVAGQQKQAIIG